MKTPRVVGAAEVRRRVQELVKQYPGEKLWLRPMRILNEEFRYHGYHSVGCGVLAALLDLVSIDAIVDGGTDYGIDIQTEESGLVETFLLTKEGHAYARRQLGNPRIEPLPRWPSLIEDHKQSKSAKAA